LGKILDYGFGNAVQAVITADATPRVTVVMAPSPRTTLDLQARVWAKDRMCCAGGDRTGPVRLPGDRLGARAAVVEGIA
jgi:hypothetical protein